MGQAQSFTTAADRQNPLPPPPPPATNPPPPPSMEALVSEAMAFGEDGGEESLDAKVQKALECPCVAGLRSGPCGTQFTEAFACFLRSTSEEKGSDCVSPFIALQNCIKANPNAFSKDVLEEEEEEEEESGKEHNKISNNRIIPPSWSRETRQFESFTEIKSGKIDQAYVAEKNSLNLCAYMLKSKDQELQKNCAKSSES